MQLLLLLTFLATLVTSQDLPVVLFNEASQLNVPLAPNWPMLMTSPVTNGKTFYHHTNNNTIASLVPTWGTSSAFTGQLIAQLPLLARALETRFTGQLFTYSSGSGHLETVLVALRREANPADPENPVEVACFSVFSNAVVKPQYTKVQVKKCHRCFPKIRCCHHVWENVPRGLTPTELLTIQNVLKKSEYDWLSQNLPQSHFLRDTFKSLGAFLPTQERPAIEDFICHRRIADNRSIDYSKIDKRWFSEIQAKISFSKTRGLPDSILVPYMTSWWAENQLDFNPSQLVAIEALFQNPAHSSYLFEFTRSEVDEDKNTTSVWFFWSIIYKTDGGDFDVYLASSSLNAEYVFMESAQVFNVTTLDENGAPVSPYVSGDSSTTKDNADIRELMSFFTYSVERAVVPTCPPPSLYRRLYADAPVPSSDAPVATPTAPDAAPKSWVDSLTNYGTSILSVIEKAAALFKYKVTKTTCDVTRFGFSTFMLHTIITKAIGMPPEVTPLYVDALVKEHQIPMNTSTLLGFEYAKQEYFFENMLMTYTGADGRVYSSIFAKTVNPDGDFGLIFAHLDVGFHLAPNLRVVTTTKSIGAFYESAKTKIIEVPRNSISLEETMLLQEYFQIVFFGRIANSMNATITWPKAPEDKMNCYKS